MSEVGVSPRVLHPDETDLLPGQVYLACHPDSGSGGLMLEVRDVAGRPVVLAYSSLARFVEDCGADQPWVLIPADRLAESGRDDAGGSSWALPGFQFGVVLDMPLPPELRGTAGSMAAEEPRWDADDSQDWPLVYLASQPFPAGAERVNLELQPMPGDRLAIMAYTSRTALEVGCGPYQASVPVPAGLVSEARHQSRAHTICLDTPLPPHLRHGPSGGI